MNILKSSILLLVLITAVACQECLVKINQQQRTTWSSDAGNFALYDVQLQNIGSTDISALVIGIEQRLESFWEVQQIEGTSTYTLPEWRSAIGGVPSTSHHQFGYIINDNAAADISIVACVPAGGSVTPPTDAPAEEQPTEAPAVEPTEEPATDAPVEPTEAPAVEPTEEPAVEPTEEPAVEPTEEPAVVEPTEAPVEPTEAPVEPTAAPTDEPTGAPTEAPVPPTERPTRRPTRRPDPTTEPTTKPADPTTTTKATTKATNPPSTGGKVCGSGTWWQPAPLTTYQWQLTGTIDTSVDVQMYDIDLFDTSAAVISKLHADGRVVICYFSTQYENWRPDAKDFPSSALGNALDDWVGEKYVDIRSSAIRNVMKARLDLAASKGCDGVEPDNVDGYTANTGFPIKAADQLDYNKFLAAEAHKRGLSIGLKNDLDHAAVLMPYFDWALNEQCYQYNECPMLNVFVNAGKAVFNTEYSGSASKICPYMNNLKFTSLIKSLDLGAKITANCCTYSSSGCAGATYVCGSSTSALIAETTKEENANNEPEIALSQVVDSSSTTITYSAIVIIAAIMCGLIMA